MPENNRNEQVEADSGNAGSGVSEPPYQPSSEQAKANTDTEQTRQIQNLKRKMVWTWVVASFGPLIALAGVVFSGLQWKAADEQVQIARAQLQDARTGAADAKAQTDRALSVAEQQATSLKQLADANSSLIALQTRPHISVAVGSNPIDPITATHPTMQQQPLSARIVLSSDRATTARDVDVRAAIEYLGYREAPRPSRMRLLYHNATVGTAYFTLRPEFRYANGAKVGPISAELIKALSARQSRLLIYGKVTYNGVSGECYWSRFCFEYAVPLDNAEPTEWLACAEHNDEGECGGAQPPIAAPRTP